MSMEPLAWLWETYRQNGSLMASGVVRSKPEAALDGRDRLIPLYPLPDCEAVKRVVEAARKLRLCFSASTPWTEFECEMADALAALDSKKEP